MSLLLPDKKRWLESLSFLEQKDGLEPLPVYTPNLIEVMKTGSEENLPWTLFVEGMLILLAADPDFAHAQAYREKLSSDPALLPLIRQRLDELAELRHPLAFPFAVGLYAMAPDQKTAALLSALYLSEDPEESLRLFDAAKSTDDPEALKRLLPVARQLKPEETERLLAGLIEKDPAGAQLYRGQLHVLQQERALTEAQKALEREDFHRVIEIADDIGETLRTPELTALRGTANQGLGLFDASIRDLEEAIQKGAASPERYNDLSIAYYLTGDAEQAIETLLEGIRILGEDERMRYNLFVYGMQTDRTDLAAESLEKLRQMHIRDPQIRQDLARIFTSPEE